ncbi:iron chelate uptake ABC transporter family permease subunit [Methylopila sp. Yamaguchi]|uniref:iron chelate uptake ABC transporter family permease subunit n=1 Tax=Methylopila sp. Yamaguchi TaxID=1437817 RepID=UPI000CAAD647|nr:iron chelate uptake ABC transporter family permease subunit [Methylopila sp. Yamaguchi]GBD50481.1 iron(III) ABC transporter permease [Methylopila sp. Yamaguchi]
MLKRERVVLASLAGLALVATAAFLGLNLRGDLAFALELRGVRLLALVLVAVAVAASTVTFQTVTANRILTPAIMGLDALYAFGQTALVFGLGAYGFASLDPRLKFAGESTLMLVMALALFLPLLRARMDVTLMLLSGVVLGVLFRSLSALLIRLVDPTAFAAIQGASFASFNAVRSDLLAIAGVVTILAVAAIWRARHALDVLALGADPATGLGLDWRRSAVGLLALTALLVAVSTALVGPVVFLGLFVVAVAERLVDTRRHAVLLPAAALVGVVILVGGQALLQHGLGGEGALGIVVEFLGGVVFLALLISEARR